METPRPPLVTLTLETAPAATSTWLLHLLFLHPSHVAHLMVWFNTEEEVCIWIISAHMNWFIHFWLLNLPRCFCGATWSLRAASRVKFTGGRLSKSFMEDSIWSLLFAGDSFPEMSPGSSCSFTSGTPSSDHRFHDFIAEKSGNGSYCGYSEDDDSSLDRPHRTNSVGSKPEQFRSRKNRWGLPVISH